MVLEYSTHGYTVPETHENWLLPCPSTTTSLSLFADAIASFKADRQQLFRRSLDEVQQGRSARPTPASLSGATKGVARGERAPAEQWR